jgi:hypothetical protein
LLAPTIVQCPNYADIWGLQLSAYPTVVRDDATGAELSQRIVARASPRDLNSKWHAELNPPFVDQAAKVSGEPYSVISYIVLRALAARKMPRKRKI